jgi:hypothetical protein
MTLRNIGSLRLYLSTGRHNGFQCYAPPNLRSGLLPVHECAFKDFHLLTLLSHLRVAPDCLAVTPPMTKIYL